MTITMKEYTSDNDNRPNGTKTLLNILCVCHPCIACNRIYTNGMVWHVYVCVHVNLVHWLLGGNISDGWYPPVFYHSHMEKRYISLRTAQHRNDDDNRNGIKSTTYSSLLVRLRFVLRFCRFYSRGSSDFPFVHDILHDFFASKLSIQKFSRNFHIVPT